MGLGFGEDDCSTVRSGDAPSEQLAEGPTKLFPHGLHGQITAIDTKERDQMRFNRTPLIGYVSIVLCCFWAGSCTAIAKSPTPRQPAAVSATMTQLEVQAVVMQMADDYMAQLGEAIYLVAGEARNDPRARWLAMSFLRNGVGAAVDIATGPNPAVSILDLLVLSSLQTWAFEKQWVPAGIDPTLGAATVERLKKTERDLWQSSSRVLSDQQRQTLRELIEAWKQANPDRTVVSFVRFDEFSDARRLPASGQRNKASGLMREVSQATATVEDTRLLGERLIWFAGRYPYILGEQSELTMYRMLDQPEIRDAAKALKSIERMSEAMANRADKLSEDLAAQQDRAFASLRAERSAAIDQVFERFSTERKALLDDLKSREEELGGLFAEIRDTLGASTDLASTLTQTAQSVDTIISRFDADPDDTSEPLDIRDLRDTAIEATKAAERATTLLQMLDQTLASEAWAQRFGEIHTMTTGMVDQLFWRGLSLILVLLAGLAALRLLPKRPPHLTMSQ